TTSRSPRAPIYSSSAPSVFPVFGLTKCNCWQAKQATASYFSPSSFSTASAVHPCTLKPVFGHRNRKGAIRFANPTAPAKALILIKNAARTLEDFHSGVHRRLAGL